MALFDWMDKAPKIYDIYDYKLNVVPKIENQYQNYMPSIEIQEIDHTKRFPHLEDPETFLEQVEILFDINNGEELSTK